jgi:protein SCO1
MTTSKLSIVMMCTALMAPSPSFAQKSKYYSDTGDDRAEGAQSPVEKEVSVVEQLGEQIPLDVQLTDHTGKTVTLSELFRRSSRPKVITPVYFSCPTMCNTILQGVVATLKSTNLKLGDDYDLISYSIDPTETPALAADKRLKLIHDLGYASGTSEWPFLVGDAVQTKRLSDALGFKYKYDDDLKQYAHSAVFMILTADGKLSRYVYGVRYPPKEVRLSLVEASQGKSGTTWDRVQLTCLRWDPASRRYELLISAVIKGGGTLVFLALATMMAVFWRRELKFGTGKKPSAPVNQGDAARRSVNDHA